jgi:hypothetical protein
MSAPFSMVVQRAGVDHKLTSGTIMVNGKVIGKTYDNEALVDFEGHNRIRQVADNEAAISTFLQCKGRNDGNTFSGFHHGDLRLHIIQHESGVIGNAGSRKMLVNELLHGEERLQGYEFLAS